MGLWGPTLLGWKVVEETGAVEGREKRHYQKGTEPIVEKERNEAQVGAEATSGLTEARFIQQLPPELGRKSKLPGRGS